MIDENTEDDKHLKDIDPETFIQQSLGKNLAVSSPNKKTKESKYSLDNANRHVEKPALDETSDFKTPQNKNDLDSNPVDYFNTEFNTDKEENSLLEKTPPIADNKNTNTEDRTPEVLMDLPVDISVILGSADLSVSDLLLMGQGSIIELDKMLGDNLDVLINNRPIATGNIVLSNDVFGCKVSHILSPSERLKKMVFEK